MSYLGEPRFNDPNWQWSDAFGWRYIPTPCPSCGHCPTCGRDATPHTITAPTITWTFGSPNTTAPTFIPNTTATATTTGINPYIVTTVEQEKRNRELIAQWHADQSEEQRRLMDTATNGVTEDGD